MKQDNNNQHRTARICSNAIFQPENNICLYASLHPRVRAINIYLISCNTTQTAHRAATAPDYFIKNYYKNKNTPSQTWMELPQYCRTVCARSEAYSPSPAGNSFGKEQHIPRS